jgi:hypothetical protein
MRDGGAAVSRPSLGVCGVCGCAVVRPTYFAAHGTTGGHTYDHGRLVRVRCQMHDEARAAYEHGMAVDFGPDWRDSTHPRRLHPDEFEDN